MSGHWRFYGTACLLLAGLSTWPAFSNPLTDLLNPAPKEAAAPTPVAVRDECLSQPGRSTAPGRHWVYHLNGHRRCWYQANEATFLAKKQIRHHFARRPAVAHEEDEAELGKETVLDARAQMFSAAPAGGRQSAASAPEAVDTASVRTAEAATPVPAATIAAQPTIDSPAPGRAAPHSVDVEMLLAASTVDGDTAASSVPPATADASSAASADTWESMAARMGAVLIALGFVFLAGALLASRALGSRALGPRETSTRRGPAVDRDGAMPFVARRDRLLLHRTG
jgi:hypothetical protein